MSDTQTLYTVRVSDQSLVGARAGNRELEVEALTPLELARYRAFRHPGLLVGAAIVVLLALGAIFAPLIAPYNPLETNAAMRLTPPAWTDGGSWAHPLGTDGFGRDLMSRVVYGSRISLGIGVSVALISMLIGTTLGLIGGYFGGRVDAGVNFVITTKLAMPQLVVLLALISIFGSSVVGLILMMSALSWDRYSIVIRPLVMRMRQQEFAVAADVIGASRVRILVGELLPNVTNQILVIMTVEMGLVITVEAGISFLGLGLPPPTPSWGLMIAEGREYILFAPYLVVIPGVMLLIASLSIYLLGDGIGDLFAPDA